jgi:hypothetical protein
MERTVSESCGGEGGDRPICLCDCLLSVDCLGSIGGSTMSAGLPKTSKLTRHIDKQAELDPVR